MKDSIKKQIFTKAYGEHGAWKGRPNFGMIDTNQRVFDCRVPGSGDYDVGGAYWGSVWQMRVRYQYDQETNEVTAYQFYRSRQKIVLE